MNHLSSHYIILLHTEELFLSFEEKYNSSEKSLSKRPTVFQRAENIMNYPPKKQINIKKDYKDIYELNDQPLSSNHQNIIKEDIILCKNAKKTENSISPLKRNSTIKVKHKKKKKIVNQINNNNLIKKKDKNDIKEIYKNTNENLDKVKNKKNYNKRFIKKSGFTFFKYLWYFICCKRNNNKIDFYSNFRTSLISEENIIQDHYDIYKLLKAYDVNRKGIDNSNIKNEEF